MAREKKSVTFNDKLPRTTKILINVNDWLQLKAVKGTSTVELPQIHDSATKG